jgi:hypothetical protein
MLRSNRHTVLPDKARFYTGSDTQRKGTNYDVVVTTAAERSELESAFAVGSTRLVVGKAKPSGASDGAVITSAYFHPSTPPGASSQRLSEFFGQPAKQNVLTDMVVAAGGRLVDPNRSCSRSSRTSLPSRAGTPTTPTAAVVEDIRSLASTPLPTGASGGCVVVEPKLSAATVLEQARVPNDKVLADGASVEGGGAGGLAEPLVETAAAAVEQAQAGEVNERTQLVSQNDNTKPPKKNGDGCPLKCVMM